MNRPGVLELPQCGCGRYDAPCDVCEQCLHPACVCNCPDATKWECRHCHHTWWDPDTIMITSCPGCGANQVRCIDAN